MRVVCLALVTSLLSACDDDRQAAEMGPIERAERFESVMHAPRVSFGDVLGEPSRYEGQTVRIDGDVSRMLNPRAILLETTGVIGKQTILVLTREPANPMGWMLQSGQQAVAVGIVRTKDVASIERELGRQLEPEVERMLGDGPVIIASSIGRVHGDNIDWTNPAGIRTRPNS